MSKLTKNQRCFWDTLKFSYNRASVLTTNKQIIKHIILSNKLKRVTEPLARSIIDIAKRMIIIKGYEQHIFKDDLVGQAVLQMSVSIRLFNPIKSNDAFKYLFTVSKSAFIRVLCAEKKQQELKKEQILNIALENIA